MLDGKAERKPKANPKGFSIAHGGWEIVGVNMDRQRG